ncbi:hypothetical protein [Herbiconiux sp. A18JL235]|uniref:Lipoprotein n=1 Tax=Herbiconiux sp. A18JL235 TaxID=3152363 RepID=A0AB39BM45_9MICO
MSAATLTVGLLTGCSSVSEFVTQQASDTACAAITPVVDQVTADVQTAVSQIPVDPAAAIDTLQAANVLLSTLPGQSESVDTARTTIDALISQAQSVQLGQRLDQTKVDDLSAQLAQALTGTIGVC